MESATRAEHLHESCAELREAALALCGWFQLPMQDKLDLLFRFAREAPTPDAPHKAERSPKAAKTAAPVPDEDGPNKPLGFALRNLDCAFDGTSYVTALHMHRNAMSMRWLD